MQGEASRAVVLLSGGMDSATCLALAHESGLEIHAVSFRYGQRHDAELDAAAGLATRYEVASHRVLQLDLGELGGSALTDTSIPVPTTAAEGIPTTYVPARNTVFLSLALAVAEVVDADEIHVGVNAVDYSGYPDCRPEYIDAFRNLARLATKKGVEGQPVAIRAPLIDMRKADIIRQGSRLGVDYGLTVSCYQADAEGAACGECDACRLRQAGFAAAGITDPTRYQSL